MPSFPKPPDAIIRKLRHCVVIPAHPLALNRARKLDEKRQRALTRYYLCAGAGGIAIGVHTTQFAIRNPEIGLYRPVLALATQEIDAYAESTGKSIIKIAGIVGETKQAVEEARLSAELGYHLGLVSVGALQNASNQILIEHLREIAQIIPVMGFYLQPLAGGRVLDYFFWREAAEIENLLAIKIAPFNRYFTLDVVRAVADAGRAGDIAIYTGNDDNIVVDLLTTFAVGNTPNPPEQHIAGGLLGHWAFWTHSAVKLLEEIRQIREKKASIPPRLLTLAQQITDANQAIFDAHNNFRGCIPGIHEILRRQGFLDGLWTLDADEMLSPGQIEEIDRVCTAYPHLSDDEFVEENLEHWLR